MRILRFDLLAYGCFTGCALDLSGGHEGLHVVYGPNEAGKSTALRALTCLLYGFDSSCPDAHVHPYGDLRVGALLQGKDGSRLECIRRKGNKNTLRGPDDTTVVDSSLLEGLLGRVDKDSFSHRFGISHVELEAGGKLIAAGKGDLGESLFAAAAGTANLARVRKDFAAAAGELFKPSGSIPRVNKALREWKEQQQRVKDSQVRVAEWETSVRTAEQAQEELARIQKRLIELETEKRRCEQFLQALPDAAQHEELIKALESLGSFPRLAANFDERLRAARGKQSQAEVLAGVAKTELERIAGELKSLRTEGKLLGQRKEIEQLTKALGGIEKAREDRPKLAERQRVLEGECQRLWQQLDPQLSAGASAQRLKATQRARLNELVAENPRLAAELAAAERACAALAREAEQFEERLRSAPQLPDVRGLRSAARTAEGFVAAEREQAESRQRLDLQLRRIQQTLAQLGWKQSAEELLSQALPSLETIEQFRLRLERAAADATAREQELGRIERERRECENRAEQLRLTLDAPTEEEVAVARSQRNEGWLLVLAAWRKELPAKAAVERFVAAFPPATELSQAYELAVRRADDLADRLRRETAQVTLKCELRSQLTALEAERLRAEARHAEAVAAVTRTSAEWMDLWQATGITPRSPLEMRAWREKVDDLAALSAAHAEQASLAQSQSLKLDQARSGLESGLHEIGRAPPPKQSLAALVELASEYMQQLEQQAQDQQSLARDVRLRREKLPALEAQKQQAGAALESWRSAWAEALEPLALSAKATPAEANAVLVLVDEIQEKQRESAGLAERIAGMDRDEDAFTQRVAALVARSAGDLAALPPAVAIESLAQRLVAEANLAAQREELAKAQRSAEEKLRSAQEAQLLAGKELEALCREAGCASANELPAAAERAHRREALATKLAETEERLRRCAAGARLENFLPEVAATTDAAMSSRLLSVKQELSELSHERDTARDRVNAAERELAKIDGSAAAAEAQAAAEKAAADVGAGAEEYCRLQLAGAVLAKAVERYRDKNKGELIQRASDLFQELTRGSFQGLRADFNEAGDPILVGVRIGGKTVGVEEMSEGTRDQLYLALRLASVETHCRAPGMEPLPLVVDDVLVHFDDDRSAAALRALARLAEHTQVVFFTHHEHLINLARETLDDDVLFVQRLEGQGSAAPLAAGANRSEE